MPASQAGSTIDCACGHEISVPRLSELRLAAGQTAHRLSVVERINGMIKNLELPADSLCASCCRETDQVAWFRVQCEKAWSRDPTNNEGIAVWLFGWVAALATALTPRRGYQAPEIHGRELFVVVPLNLCTNCLDSSTNKVGRREAKTNLSTVPIYLELFQEYPHAGIDLDRTDSTTRA